MSKVRLATMNLISAEICGKNLDADLIKSLNDEELKSLYALSKKHDVGHIVGDALIKCGLLKNEEVKAAFEKQVLAAVYRGELMNAEIEEIGRVLEECSIPFILLKGSVIRFLYPESWMRTSCDIDILVQRNDIKHIIEILTKKYGYTFSIKTQHDYSVYSPSGVHIELHFILVFHKEFGKDFTRMVWETAQSASGYNFKKNMAKEFFLVYHMAHMSQHILEGGGCGIKPFIDLMIIGEKMGIDVESANKILAQYGLLKFTEKSFALSEYWFNNGVGGAELCEFERFILEGGVYGTTENRSSVGVVKQKNKVGYVFGRLFVSYDRLCLLYPSLKKCPILMPFYQIRRWFRLFNKNGVKIGQALNEIKITVNINPEKVERSAKLMDELGLIERKK